MIDLKIVAKFILKAKFERKLPIAPITARTANGFNMRHNHNYDKKKWENVGKNKKIKTKPYDPVAGLLQGKCLF